MNTRTIAILVCTIVLALPAEGRAAKKGGLVALFQDALASAEQVVESSGVFDEQTRSAMQSLQAQSGLAVTEYPDAGTLSILGIPPSVWTGVVSASGAPESDIQNATEAANQEISSDLAGSMHDVFAPAATN